MRDDANWRDAQKIVNKEANSDDYHRIVSKPIDQPCPVCGNKPATSGVFCSCNEHRIAADIYLGGVIEIAKERDALKAALRFYADDENWKSFLGIPQTPVEKDKGQRARQALGEEP